MKFPVIEWVMEDCWNLTNNNCDVYSTNELFKNMQLHAKGTKVDATNPKSQPDTCLQDRGLNIAVAAHVAFSDYSNVILRAMASQITGV